LTKYVYYSVTENIVTVSVGQMAFEIVRYINLLVASCQFLTNDVIVRRPRNVHTFILR